MPRVEITPADLVRTGTGIGAAGTEVTGDATNQHMFLNNGREFLLARNSSGATTRNVTLVPAQTVDGQAVAGIGIAVLLSSTKVIGPFPPGIYNQISGADIGKCYFNVDHADLRFQVFRVTG